MWWREREGEKSVEAKEGATRRDTDKPGGLPSGAFAPKDRTGPQKYLERKWHGARETVSVRTTSSTDLEQACLVSRTGFTAA